MKKKLLLGLLAAAAVSFTACQKNEVISEMPQDNAIGFGTYVGRDAQTKATVINETALGTQGLGVFAYYTGASDYASATEPKFMYNEKVWNESGWKYTNTKYWPGNEQKISFFAYAPYVSTADAIITALPDANTEGDPTIGFAVPETVTNQIDLLYATPVKNAFEGTVNFTFNHALTRIGFKVKTARTDYRVNISSITLTGDFNTAGTLNLNTGTWSGENNETTSDSYELNFTTATNINSTEGVAINATEGYVMTIPTNFSSGNLSVSVTYTYEYKVSDGVWAAAVNDTKDGNVTVNFEKGKAYTLVMTLDPLTPIQFNVTAVTGWDETHGGFNPGTDVTI